MASVRLLDPEVYRDIVKRALQEDIGEGDVTTDATVSPLVRGRGVFLVNADCVIAGLDVAFEAFRRLDADVRVTTNGHDGDRRRAGEPVAAVVGSAAALLAAERTALIFYSGSPASPRKPARSSTRPEEG